jgi:hypothetical protein
MIVVSRLSLFLAGRVTGRRASDTTGVHFAPYQPGHCRRASFDRRKFV